MPSFALIWQHSYLKMSLYPPQGPENASDHFEFQFVPHSKGFLSLCSYNKVSAIKCLASLSFGNIPTSKCHCTPPQGPENASDHFEFQFVPHSKGFLSLCSYKFYHYDKTLIQI